MPHFAINLVRCDIIQPQRTLFERIRRALEPLSERAGKELVLRPTQNASSHSPEIVFSFQLYRTTGDTSERLRRPSANWTGVRAGEQMIRGPGMILAETGTIFVNAILEMRALGGPVYRRGNVDYAAQTAPLFHNGEQEFASAVGNIAVHEIAHVLGLLDHVHSPDNYMSTGADNQVFGWTRRRQHLRYFWSSPKVFSAAQQAILIEAIRTNQYGGDITIGNATQ